MIRLDSIRRVGGPLTGDIGSARAPLRERTGFVISVVDERGRAGIGEASPYPSMSPESESDVEACLDALSHALERAPALDLETTTPNEAEGFVDALDRGLSTRRPEDSGRRQGMPASARFALEVAVADLIARAQGVSVATWLSGSTPSSIARSVLLGAIDRADIVELAIRQVQRGARTLKLKVKGDRPDDELAVLLEIRRAVTRATQVKAADLRLRLDLNGGLEVEAALVALRAYARADVELCEEPVRGPLLSMLGRSAVSWFADESLTDPRLRRDLLADEACAGFVLKPTLFGLFAARALALAAMSAGKKVVLTHMFEGPVGLAAVSELVLSLPTAQLAAGLDRHTALDAFPSIAVPQLGEALPGEILSVRASTELGLGIVWASP